MLSICRLVSSSTVSGLLSDSAAQRIAAHGRHPDQPRTAIGGEKPPINSSLDHFNSTHFAPLNLRLYKTPSGFGDVAARYPG